MKKGCRVGGVNIKDTGPLCILECQYTSVHRNHNQDLGVWRITCRNNKTGTLQSAVCFMKVYNCGLSVSPSSNTYLWCCVWILKSDHTHEVVHTHLGSRWGIMRKKHCHPLQDVVLDLRQTENIPTLIYWSSLLVLTLFLHSCGVCVTDFIMTSKNKHPPPPCDVIITGEGKEQLTVTLVTRVSLIGMVCRGEH
jgi:hypothetical protein